MSQTRQQNRNEKRKLKKQVKQQKREIHEPLLKGEFIQHMIRMESNLSILTKFINQQFPTEFEQYIKDLQKEADQIEKDESNNIEDVEVVEDSVFNQNNEKGETNE